MACTVFLVEAKGQVLAGNNEDAPFPYTQVTYLAPEKGKHGVVFFGFDHYYQQGGLNDAGLFCDGLALPPEKVTGKGRPLPPGMNIIEKAMRECTSVKQVVALFSTYDRSRLDRAQLFFGDKTGDAVIIEGNHLVRKQGSYLLATNFRQSSTPPQKATCARYRIADALLKKGSASVAELRGILAAVHAEPTSEGTSATVYSNIYDLKLGLVYLYNFHNLEDVVVIDLKKELAKGSRHLALPSLFAPTFAAQKFVEARRAVVEKLKAESRRSAKLEDPRLLEALVGHYESAADGLDFIFTRKGGDLWVRSVGLWPQKLLRVGDELIFSDGYLRLRFLPGKPPSVKVRVLNHEATVPRTRP